MKAGPCPGLAGREPRSFSPMDGLFTTGRTPRQMASHSPAAGEKGSSLLEVMIATALLGAAGLSVIGVVKETVRQVQRAQEAGAQLARANQAMIRLVLLDREELVRRIGEHPWGEFIVSVQRPARSLYRIALRDSTAVSGTLLVTLVARPDSLP